MTRPLRALAMGLAGAVLSICLTAAHASGSAKPPKTARPAASSKTAQAGYDVRPTPSWVRPQALADRAPGAPLKSGSKARRDLLADTQVMLGERTQVVYTRLARTALDTSTLREISEPTIVFNPAFQRLTLHELTIVRDGQRLDRLADLHVELMRREQGLERQSLDGTQTALLMLRDVRVGDIVDVAYSIEGSNPIFNGHFSELFHLASDAQTDLVHLRIEAPKGRPLFTRGVPQPVSMDPHDEGDRQVWELRRENVAGIEPEDNVPPWHKVFPAVHVTQYANWDEVEKWAEPLFAANPPEGEVAQRIAQWRSRNLPPEALLADVLRFVQDDIRYFSVSLGESSHRPKRAVQTLADRMGDCKDKVVLLNTLLTGLGFDPRPALVSTFRNRGLTQYLPSHDQFDHVVSAVTLNGQRYFLDATFNGQGLGLRTRGYVPFGQALVIGDHQPPEAVTLPSFAVNTMSHRQEWDVSDPNQPAHLRVNFVARGLAAERWRAAIASNGLDRLMQNFAGAYLRIAPGLKLVGSPELTDQRDKNELTVQLNFVRPDLADYKQGGIDMDLSGIELGDVLSLPTEVRRRYAFLLDTPTKVDLTMAVHAPNPFTATAPAAQQAGDRHFQLTTRYEIHDRDVQVLVGYDRLQDEVLPDRMGNYREQVMRARGLASQHLRLSLLDKASVEALSKDVQRNLMPYWTGKPDALIRILQDNEFTRQASTQVLRKLDANSPLRVRVLTARAMANNLLDHGSEGLQDAEAALAIEPENADALEARGVALVEAGRLEEATKAFEHQNQLNGASPSAWLGISYFMQGQYDKASAELRQRAQDSTGELRGLALLWMQLTAMRQSVPVPMDPADANLKWQNALLQCMANRLSDDDLFEQAKSDDPAQARLRMAEASFYIGQKALAQHRPDDARDWFEEAVGSKALPYIEYMLAKLELRRMKSAP